MKINLQALKEKASLRPAGYYEDVLAHGTLKDGWLEIAPTNYKKLLQKYNPEALMPVVSNCCGNKKQPLTRPIPVHKQVTGSFKPVNVPPSGSQAFPPLTTQMGNAFGAARRVVGAVMTGNKVKASEEEVKRRTDICNACEFFKSGRCLKCGCFLRAKLLLETEKCPAGKWEI